MIRSASHGHTGRHPIKADANRNGYPPRGCRARTKPDDAPSGPDALEVVGTAVVMVLLYCLAIFG